MPTAKAMTRDRMLKLEQELVSVLARDDGILWPEDVHILEKALDVVRRFLP